MNTQMKTLMSQRIFNSKTCRIPFAICLSALCLIALSTQAATITVMNSNDSAAGSLRQALADALDGDTINFDSALNEQTITLTSGELLVNKSVTINGPGSNNLTIDGNHASRVFHVSGGVTAIVAGLTITNGHVSGSYPNDNGGGIYNDHSTLTVSNCTISANYAYGLRGGGIYNDGVSGSAILNVTNSTLSGNSVAYGGGGGIYNDGVSGSATLTVTNSTLSGNSATNGGGIYNFGRTGSGTLTVTNSTFSDNGGGIVGDAIFNDGFEGSVTLRIGDTILNARASGSNIANAGLEATVTSLGYNLSSDSGGGYLTATGDQLNTDPMLGPLQDNGGPTFTHALLPGSPAIDAGDPNFTPPPDYDQRGPGFPRVLSARIDIGALEVPPTPTPSPTPTATPTPTPTPTYAAQIQQPINADGTSAFNGRRGVVPVRFTLTFAGVPTCDLPPATIAVYRTGTGGNQQVDESVYSGPADTGSSFRIDSCQYVYNLSVSALGVGTYRVDAIIGAQVVGTATFALR
jgi:hypothetical protein